MLRKPLIYLANTTSTSVLANGTIPFPTTVRRKFCSLSNSGGGVVITNNGVCDDYYNVDVLVTFTAPATGNVTISILQDGVPIVGANATVTIATADTEVVTVTIPATIKVTLSGSPDTITVISSSAITVSNATIRVTEE